MAASAAGSPVPVPRTPLIGRERDLTTLHELMLHADERVLTLTGVGGCGKTRLAGQLAAEFAPAFSQRVWFVELAAVADPALVPFSVAAALGVQETAESAIHTAIAAALSPQPALLVLDNCEHLIDACATFADDLLTACPTLRIVATSREPLQIPGERQHRVRPLAVPAEGRPPGVDVLARSPAVQLFVARAQAVARGFGLTEENAPQVAGICRRLDGIPLALELAAAQVRVLSPAQILARLHGSFRILTGSSRVAPTRQQTLRATLDWSDALLTSDERALFQRLAVFAGGFHLDTAEAVCADDALPAASILELLTRLVDKSLVTVTQYDQAARYRLLEPLREYALVGLTQSGELAATRARHATAYLQMAERAMPTLYGSVQDAWLVRLEREQGNLRAALRWAQEAGDWPLGLRLATALVPFWEVRGHLAEGRRWLLAALAAPADAVAPALRMRALAGAGRLTHLLDDYAEAEQLHSQSLALARELDDRHGIAIALTELGMTARLRQDLARSIAWIEEGLARHRELGDEAGIAVAQLNLGMTVGARGDRPRAVSILTEALGRFEALRDRRHSALAQMLLAEQLQRKGDVELAMRSIAASLAGHARLGARWFVSYTLVTLVQVQIARRQWDAAARMLGAAQAIGEGVSSAASIRVYEEIGDTIRAHLAAERFTVAWDAGHALSFDEAVTAALALTQPAAPADAVGPATPDAAPLTRREREVAALVARGLTDRQIADTLVIAPGTVGVHVHHILEKLGFHSRVQVAGWLAEQDAV